MLFNTFEFIFFFLATIVIYYLLKHKYRWIWLLLVSYYFYYAWEPKLTLLLFFSTLLDYICGINIYNSKKKFKRKAFLLISIGVNLGLLMFFKYLGFFTDTSLAIMHFFGLIEPDAAQTDPVQLFSRILLPIGISFYTFQTLSYSIEIYRGNLEPEQHFGRYALYVSFFPQLVAGPIERAQNLLPQLRKKISLDINNIRIGFMLMAWGYFMKMVVADRLGIYVDAVFSNPTEHSGLPLIIGAYFFTFQIYFDFAAYSILAIGAARVLGFKLMTNFNRPIYTLTANDFWSHWHISLMTWLRDYLYRPLVKSLRFKRHWALLVVFIVSGLWHGAGWNFVIWGTMNGLFIMFELGTKTIRKKLIQKLSRIIPRSFFKYTWWFIVFNFICFSLIFFRSLTFESALQYIQHIPNITNSNIDVLKDPFELILCFVTIIIVQTVHYFKRDDLVYELVTNKSPIVRWCIYILFIITIVFFTAIRNNAFIYFQF